MAVNVRNRSPRPLPAVDRDLLSSSGRLLAPPLPSSFTSSTYIGSRREYTPPHIKRYDSQERSPVRYKSRSPRREMSRSRSPLRTQQVSRERVRARSASRSPEALRARRSPEQIRPPKRLLGKTPPLPPSRSQSLSPPPARYVREVKGVPVTRSQRDLSQSPRAYSSRKVSGAYTPPSPQPRRSLAVSPGRKRNSPPPKAYALSPNKHLSLAWSRSRSKSMDRNTSSRSPPPRRMASRSSSSTSPPVYGRSPAAAQENFRPVAVKREAPSPDRKVQQTSVRSPAQRHNHSCTSSKHSRSPEVSKHERNMLQRRACSPVARRRSPSPRSHMPDRRASPEKVSSRPYAYRRPSPVATAHWSRDPRRSN